MDEEDPHAHPLMMYKFPYVKMGDVRLDKAIAANRPEAQQFIVHLTRVRSELVSLLNSDPSAHQIITAVSDLIPAMLALGQLLSSPGIVVKKPILYAFSSCLREKTSQALIQLPDGHFDLCMLLGLLASAHGNRAFELMRSIDPHDIEDFDEKAILATEHVRVAAGLYDYLARKAIPRWVAVPQSAPYECDVIVQGAMRNLCLSMAQAIIVRKGKLHGSSKGVIAKLSVGGFRFAEVALKAVVHMKDAKCVNAGLKDFLHAHAVVHKANALKALAEDALDTEKYGLAVGLSRAATTCIMRVPAPKDKKHPLYLYKEDIETGQRIVSMQRDLFVSSNDNIYGKKEVSEKDVVIPDGTKMAKPVEYHLPKPKFNIL